jgi:uncharacterized protein
MRFEWNDDKERENRHKHGIGFQEAAAAFSDDAALDLFDVLHSGEEQRWEKLCMAGNGRVLVVVYTERRGAIRLISARAATSREQTEYARRRRR